MEGDSGNVGSGSGSGSEVREGHKGESGVRVRCCWCCVVVSF